MESNFNVLFFEEHGRLCLPQPGRARRSEDFYPNSKTPARYCAALLSKQTQPAKIARLVLFFAFSFWIHPIDKKQMEFIGKSVQRILD